MFCGFCVKFDMIKLFKLVGKIGRKEVSKKKKCEKWKEKEMENKIKRVRKEGREREGRRKGEREGGLVYKIIMVG